MEKITYRTCKKCGEKKVKVIVKEDFDEVLIDIKKCENCKYQNGLKELN